MTFRRLVPTAIVALALGAAAPAARADVDLNGHFIGGVGTVLGFGPFFCSSIDVVQSGTSISLTVVCDILAPATFTASGTINPVTGAFTATGQGTAICTMAGSLTIAATGAPDGYSFSGSVNCGGFPAQIGASRCGNGILNAGESQACDDAVAAVAPTFGAVGCCGGHCDILPSGTQCFTNGPFFGGCDALDFCDGVSPTCPDLKQPNGTLCDDFNLCTTGDHCSAGMCVGSAPAPAGTDCLPDFGDPCIAGLCDSTGICQILFTTNPCDDGDACTTNDTCAEGYCVGGPPPACNACQTCDSAVGCVATVRPGCKKPLSQKSLVALKDVSPDDKDKLTWKWLDGAATTTAEFGDPLAGTNYTLCVYDTEGSAPNLLVSAEAPAGTSWTANSSGFKYKNPALTPDGLQSITLKAGAAGKAKVLVRGRGPNLGLPPTLNAVGTPVTMHLKAENGSCWEARYPTALVSNPIEFKARGGSPGGAFLDD